MALMAGVAGACQESGDDGIMVDATGTVGALVWVDRNGNGVLEGSDGPAANVEVELTAPGGSRALYTLETGPSGEAILDDVLVGDYQAVLDSSTVGDSLRVLRVDSAQVTVIPGDTSVVLVGLTFPSLSTDSLRTAPADGRVFINGRVISEWGTFGESTVHVRDSTGAIRAIRVAPTGTQVGDSVRLVGVTAVQSGQPVLKDAQVFLVQTGVESPPPLAVTTGESATADGGRLDAELVRINDAVIQDTTRNAFGEWVLEVDDGSGVVEIVLDRDIPFLLNFPAGSEVLETPVDATGVLVPPEVGTGGRWVLKPRGNVDIAVQ